MPAAALAFVGVYLVGGTVDVPTGALIVSMLGWHTLIGVGEAVITALTVASIVAVRPDLVHGARPVLERRALSVRTRDEVAAHSKEYS